MFTEACVDEQIPFREAHMTCSIFISSYTSQLLILDANHCFLKGRNHIKMSTDVDEAKNSS